MSRKASISNRSNPILVIGGIGRENAHCFKECGIDGFAVASGIIAGKDIAGSARELKRIFDRF